VCSATDRIQTPGDMKLLILSICLVGLTLANNEVETNEIKEVKTIKLPTLGTIVKDILKLLAPLLEGTSLAKLLPLLGNIWVALEAIINTLALPTLLGVIGFINEIKIAILNWIRKPLEIINFVLAIIGLALMVVYGLLKEGDLKPLFGFEEAPATPAPTGYYHMETPEPYDTYSSYASSARALFDAPVVQRLAAMVHDAITKYDN
ncbi:hypothetical protein OTU49_000665, partial [Cherax quadricarinatus]